MQSVNFVILGKDSIASKFGKKGTVTDLTLYDKKESDVIRTWVLPNGFPDKIQPLFQAINLAEYAILHVTNLDKFTGEQIIALDILKKQEGILSHSYDVDENRLYSMIKGTILQGYKKVSPDNIKKELNNFKPISIKGKTKIIIDHCFDVKGTGTVILGKVVSGSVKQYDNLKLMPAKIDVMVKSIQMHDNPVDEALSPARVGLSLKGVKPDDINRGDILFEDDSFPVKTQIELDFKKNPFYKTNFAKNQMCLVNIGLQIKAARFVLTDPVKLVLERSAVCDTTDIAVILKPESDSIRILGSGQIRD